MNDLARLELLEDYEPPRQRTPPEYRIVYVMGQIAMLEDIAAEHKARVVEKVTGRRIDTEGPMIPLQQARDEFERLHFKAALERGHNYVVAAKILGLTRHEFRYRLAQLFPSDKAK